jgi:hypothetical protein
MATKRERTTPQFLAMVRRMITAAGARVAWADPEDLAELVELRVTLDEAIRAGVAGQRASGITWASIGEATGTTKQAAIQKWLVREGAAS